MNGIEPILNKNAISIEHHCFSVVAGKIDRLIFKSLILQGVADRSWVVRAKIDKLTELHPGNQSYTFDCLNRLIKKGLIFKVCKTRSGYLFLIPSLKNFVSELKPQTGKYANRVGV